ncbi:MAG TPA: TolC family protein [Marinilabiliaceae bacterium]|nr:TolC family protein [Marinilabiliaceae bacterium]
MNVKNFGLLLLIGFSVTMKAQEMKEDLSVEWNLNRCLSYALDNNIQLNQSQLAAQTADANLLQTRGQRLPNLSGSASQSATNNRSFNDLGESAGWNLNYGSSLSLNTGLTIYGGGQINNDIKRSLLSKEAALLTVDQTKMDISMSVVQAYLNILYAHENLKYYEEVALLSGKQLGRTQKLLDAGSVSKRDLVDMEAQLASDNYSVVTAQSNLVQRRTELKQLLEIPVEETFQVYIPEEPVTDIMMALPERFEVFDATLQNRPDVRYSSLQRDIAEVDLKNTRAAYLPTLSLSASVSTDYNNGFNSSYNAQLSDNLMQRVGLTLSVPIFNRYATKASVSRSHINIKQAELVVVNTKNKLLQAVERIYEDTYAGQQRYLAALLQERAAEESHRLAAEQYQLGMLSSIELLQTRNNWLNTNRELIQARYNTLLYRKILDYYMGIPIEL